MQPVRTALHITHSDQVLEWYIERPPLILFIALLGSVVWVLVEYIRASQGIGNLLVFIILVLGVFFISGVSLYGYDTSIRFVVDKNRGTLAKISKNHFGTREIILKLEDVKKLVYRYEDLRFGVDHSYLPTAKLFFVTTSNRRVVLYDGSNDVEGTAFGDQLSDFINMPFERIHQTGVLHSILWLVMLTIGTITCMALFVYGVVYWRSIFP